MAVTTGCANDVGSEQFHPLIALQCRNGQDGVKISHYHATARPNLPLGCTAELKHSLSRAITDAALLHCYLVLYG